VRWVQPFFGIYFRAGGAEDTRARLFTYVLADGLNGKADNE